MHYYPKLSQLEEKERIMKSAKGFSLIELMIVVVIVGILSVVAVPAYTDYVMKGKIPDATSNLAATRVKMEQYFQDNRSYGGGLGGCGVPMPTSSYFTFSCTGTGTPLTTYTITATGTGSMDGFVYTINEMNVKTSTITAGEGWNATSANCWITGKGGAC